MSSVFNNVNNDMKTVLETKTSKSKDDGIRLTAKACQTIYV